MTLHMLRQRVCTHFVCKHVVNKTPVFSKSAKKLVLMCPTAQWQCVFFNTDWALMERCVCMKKKCFNCFGMLIQTICYGTICEDLELIGLLLYLQRGLSLGQSSKKWKLYTNEKWSNRR